MLFGMSPIFISLLVLSMQLVDIDIGSSPQRSSSSCAHSKSWSGRTYNSTPHSRGMGTFFFSHTSRKEMLYCCIDSTESIRLQTHEWFFRRGWVHYCTVGKTTMRQASKQAKHIEAFSEARRGKAWHFLSHTTEILSEVWGVG